MNHANAVSLYHTRDEVIDAMNSIDETLDGDAMGTGWVERMLIERKRRLEKQLREIEAEMVEVLS